MVLILSIYRRIIIQATGWAVPVLADSVGWGLRPAPPSRAPAAPRAVISLAESFFAGLTLVVACLCVPSMARAAEGAVVDLIREALAYHPLLRSQQGRKEASRAGVEASRWQFWPTPSVSVEHAATASNQSGDGTVSYLRLQQPLWTGGRLTGNLSKAEAGAAGADAGFAEARQQLALQVVQAWSEALVAERKLRAYENSRSVHQRLLALVERRFSEGASAQADVALASGRLNTLQAELAAVVAQRNTAMDRLRLLTGRRAGVPTAEDPLNLTLPTHEARLDALVVAAREQSPSLAKTRAQAVAAEADIQIARASLSPEVFVRLERQYGNLYASGQAPVNRVFVGLSTALGGGLSGLSGIDAAQAQHRAVLEDMQAQQLALEDQVQVDYTLARAAQARLADLESARRSAAEVLDSYERQFLAGRKQWLDLMNTAREQAQSDAQLADAMGAHQLANWRLALMSRGVDSVIEEGRRMDGERGQP